MTSLTTSNIRSNYEEVLERIENAATGSGRSSNSVKLVVVTKTHPVETIYQALEAGIREFGENYVEESVEKILSFPDRSDINWHMIGHIQSRKASLVAPHFNLVHSVDSLKLANRLDRFAHEKNRVLNILLECNMSGEESKFGFPAFEKGNWQTRVGEFSQIVQFPNLKIHGLMTMPPLYDDPDKTRPYFKKLRELRDYLATELPNSCWEELSMGTSADYCTAIQEGATLVRVGTAILGSRTKPE